MRFRYTSSASRVLSQNLFVVEVTGCFEGRGETCWYSYSCCYSLLLLRCEVELLLGLRKSFIALRFNCPANLRKISKYLLP